jgi:cytoskeletal protein CcmA (bactofilin family)
MAAEPYVSKQPGDIIRAGDWNDMQSKARDEIRGHTHSGDGDGRRIPRAGIEPKAIDGGLIDPGADVTVKSLTTTDLKINGKAILGDIADLLSTVRGLNNDKLNRAGDTIKGSLTVQQDLTVGNALTVTAASTFKALLNTADVKVGGSLKTTTTAEINNGAVRLGLDEGGSGVRTISFSRDANDEGNAGKISYRGGFGGDSLNIVGAGATGTSRVVRLYDNVVIAGSKLSVGDVPDLLATVKGLETNKLNRSGDTISGSLTIQQGLTVNGDVRFNGGVQLGGFTANDAFEWPKVTWYRDIAKNWDEGLIKHASDSGVFKRAGFGVHIHESREFGIWSTGLDALLGVEGKSGNLYVKGIANAPSGLRFDGDRSTHIDCDGSLYRYNGQVYLTTDDNFYVRDYGRNKYIHLDVANLKINYVSDERLKKDFRRLSDPLAKLMSLEGLHFRWKDDGSDNDQVGFIAQQVQSRFPELVTTGPDGMLSVHYTGFIPFLIEALKEQQAQIRSLQAVLAR